MLKVVAVTDRSRYLRLQIPFVLDPFSFASPQKHIMSRFQKPMAPNTIPIFVEICSIDSGVTGHFPPLYNIKNMQSNKHVLIHTSKFKNTSVVLVSFYYVDDKVYLSRYSQ